MSHIIIKCVAPFLPGAELHAWMVGTLHTMVMNQFGRNPRQKGERTKGSRSYTCKMRLPHSAARYFYLVLLTCSRSPKIRAHAHAHASQSNLQSIFMPENPLTTFRIISAASATTNLFRSRRLHKNPLFRYELQQAQASLAIYFFFQK